MTRPQIDNRTARRLFLDLHMLLGKRSGAGKGADLQSVIDRLGFVQIDSVNTLARAHDLILWSRRQQYRAPNLPKLLKTRGAFEHWTHDASVITMSSFPMWRHKFAKDKSFMDRRWDAWRREGFRDKLDAVLQQITDQGACSSMDVGSDEKRKSGGWWDWHPSKTALEYLWRSGEIAVSHRQGFRKHYDLNLPMAHFAVHSSGPIHWTGQRPAQTHGCASCHHSTPRYATASGPNDCSTSTIALKSSSPHPNANMAIMFFQ